MKYEEMSDFQINCAVGEAIGFGHHILAKNGQLDYCKSWGDAGPIISENKIGLIWYGVEEEWCAAASYKMYEGAWDWDYTPDEYTNDKNPLRAAMIVFLMMKESDND